jgi:transcriptional activator for dhaKLM operon
MRHVRRIIKSAAPALASILIRGENGTGKNPVASAVHNESNRRDGPFLIFACASVPSELVVEELVGYEEGMSDRLPGGRPSKFELAQGGTLYFQDVEALPLEAQSILLNAIDLGIVQRLGSNRPIQVDVRIIAASSANLEELIARGNFRSDLFYRLSSFEIRMPPLRERKEDLPQLLERTVELLSRQLGRPLVVETEAVSALMKYSWPGNIRELEAVIGRAASHSGFSGRIGVEHLPDYLRHSRLDVNGPGSIHKVSTLDELNREALIRAASLYQGNASEMARQLGIGRTTLWRKLKLYNISLDEFRNSHVS